MEFFCEFFEEEEIVGICFYIELLEVDIDPDYIVLDGERGELYFEIFAFRRTTEDPIEELAIPDMCERIVVVDEDMEWQIGGLSLEVFLCFFELVRSEELYASCRECEFLHDEGVDRFLIFLEREHR